MIAVDFKLKSLLSICVLVGSIITTSCSTVLYTPSQQLAPLHKEKGELVCVGQLSTTEYTNSLAFSTSTSITNNLALGLNFNKIEDAGENEYNGKGFLFEPSVSYFTPISMSKNWVTASTVGFGIGSGQYVNNEAYDYDFRAITVTQSLGYSRKYFETGFLAKFTFAKYVNINELLYYDPYSYNNPASFSLKANSSEVFFEPSLFMRVGLKAIKLQLQVSHAAPLLNSDFPLDETSFSLGVLIDLSLNR